MLVLLWQMATVAKVE